MFIFEVLVLLQIFQGSSRIGRKSFAALQLCVAELESVAIPLHHANGSLTSCFFMPYRRNANFRPNHPTRTQTHEFSKVSLVTSWLVECLLSVFQTFPNNVSDEAHGYRLNPNPAVPTHLAAPRQKDSHFRLAQVVFGPRNIMTYSEYSDDFQREFPGETSAVQKENGVLK